MLTTDDFRKALVAELRKATAAGRASTDVQSGDLHTEVGGYPGPDHRMPMCCAAMKGEMRAGDVVIEEPPSGKGANVVIRYRLPR